MPIEWAADFWEGFLTPFAFMRPSPVSFAPGYTVINTVFVFALAGICFEVGRFLWSRHHPHFLAYF